MRILLFDSSRVSMPKIVLSISVISLALSLSSCSHTAQVPTKEEQGLALAYAGCVVGEMDDSRNYSLSNLYWFRQESISGGVASFEASQGVSWKDDVGPFSYSTQIQESSYAIQAFSTAAVLDPHWSNLSSILISAINAGSKYWTKTHDDFKTPYAYTSEYAQLSGACKAINLQVFAAAKSAKVSPHSWAKSIAGPNLP